MFHLEMSTAAQQKVYAALWRSGSNQGALIPEVGWNSNLKWNNAYFVRGSLVLTPQCLPISHSREQAAHVTRCRATDNEMAPQQQAPHTAQFTGLKGVMHAHL